MGRAHHASVLASVPPAHVAPASGATCRLAGGGVGGVLSATSRTDSCEALEAGYADRLAASPSTQRKHPCVLVDVLPYLFGKDYSRRRPAQAVHAATQR